MKIFLSQAFLMLAGCAVLFADSGKPTSYYSNTNTKNVAVLESSEFEKDPEIDHFVELCPGYGGYELIHHGGDLRSVVDIKYGETISELYVVALNRGRAKVLGSTSGKDEQAEARALADSVLKK
jgi:hypothetical protein